MTNLSDVATGLLGMGLIAGAVWLVALGGRDRTADQHDLSDYHEPVPVNDDNACDVCHGDVAECGHLQDDDEWPDDGILPPAPPGMNAGSSVFAETAKALGVWPVCAEAIIAVVADQYGDSPADRAARMLREIAAVEQAKAGIRPAYATDRRDMTGSFPVVRAAA